MPRPAANPLRNLGPVIYGPSLLFSLGEGLIVPLLPLLAIERGESLSAAGLQYAAMTLGQFLGNIPAGALVGRYPEKRAMTLAAALAGACGVLIASVPYTAALVATAFILGASLATFGLARQSFLTSHVPYSFRGRALALLGGTHRAGMVLGPFTAWAALVLTGSALTAAWIFVAFTLLTTAVIAAVPDLEERIRFRSPQARESRSPTTGREERSLIGTAAAHRGPLLRLGIPAALLALVRSGRQVLLPLWGSAMGLGTDTILFVVALSGMVDLILFYPGGKVMDRFGRMWGVLPAALIMSVGLLFLALAPQGPGPYVGSALILGAGNGLSSGALLTLASDLAPVSNPSPFIGIWRTLTQGGSALAPLLVAAVTVSHPLGAAAAGIGALGLVGVGGFIRWIPVDLVAPQ
ncbi:MAG: MFS transporter, partial [Arthrobacter sp.]